MFKLLISSAFCLLTSLSSASADAAQKHLFNEEEAIKVNLSKSRINRIGAKEEKVSKVIGNTSEFEYETDNGNIFIVPTLAVGSHFEVTLNMASGKTQALRCLVSSTDEGQIILFSANNPTLAKSIESEALETIRELALIADLKFKEFDQVAVIQPFKLIRGQKVEFKNLEGFKLLIKNTSRKPYQLREQDLVVNGYKTIAVHLETTALGPYQQTLALVAAQRR